MYYKSTYWSHTQFYHALSVTSDKHFSRNPLINQIRSSVMPVLRGDKSTDCLLQTANVFYVVLLKSME